MTKKAEKELAAMRERHQELQAEHKASLQTIDSLERELTNAMVERRDETDILANLATEQARAIGLSKAATVAEREVERLEEEVSQANREAVHRKFEKDLKGAYTEMKKIVGLMVEAAERYEAVKGKLYRPADYRGSALQKFGDVYAMKDTVELLDYPQTRGWPGWGDWLSTVRKKPWSESVK